MSVKEDFLSLKTYEEFDERRHDFKNLDMADDEVREHLDVIFEKSGIPNHISDGVMVDFRKGEPPAK